VTYSLHAAPKATMYVSKLIFFILRLLAKIFLCLFRYISLQFHPVRLRVDGHFSRFDIWFQNLPVNPNRIRLPTLSVVGRRYCSGTTGSSTFACKTTIPVFLIVTSLLGIALNGWFRSF
jgi:hypothetical protein